MEHTSNTWQRCRLSMGSAEIASDSIFPSACTVPLFVCGKAPGLVVHLRLLCPTCPLFSWCIVVSAKRRQHSDTGTNAWCFHFCLLQHCLSIQWCLHCVGVRQHQRTSLCTRARDRHRNTKGETETREGRCHKPKCIPRTNGFCALMSSTHCECQISA